MVKGIGVDIVLLQRFSGKNKAFVERILTEKEYQQYQDLNEIRRVEYLAGRFCAKEAYYKACHDHSLSYHDVEVLDDPKAGLTISGPGARVSLSHDGEYVVAFVIVEE